MYCGRLVEDAPVDTLFASPRHPYSAGLIDSVPRLRDEKLARLPTIPGLVPNPAHLPSGCRFRDRCHNAQSECAEASPELRELGPTRAACYYPEPKR
jgi:oligopeptide/dipeptide ABC transporter ATP-binding protein